LWRFLVLEDDVARIDGIDYFIGNVDKILGILMLPFQESSALD
jgi:hypothetical protein